MHQFFAILALLATAAISWSAEIVVNKTDTVNYQSSRGDLDKISRHYVIRPQIHNSGHSNALYSTLSAEDGLHLPHITLSYYHRGHHVHIDLQRNDHLLSTDHFLRYQSLETHTGYKNYTKNDAFLCHYQGSILGIPDSRAAVSTCNGGINGVIFDGNESFFIHSDSAGHLQNEHILFRDSDLRNSTMNIVHNIKNVKFDQQENINGIFEILHHNMSSKTKRILRYKRSKNDFNVTKGPYNADKYTSYIELVIVVDNGVYKSFNESTTRVHQYCIGLANILNMNYNPLNIYIVLMGVVIWNKSNEIIISSDALVTLNNFLHYRRTKLVMEHPNDNAQLLTTERFYERVLGKAKIRSICSYNNSGGVIQKHSEVIGHVAATMAHEIGHNLGMAHDESLDCKCQDEKCIMSASSTSVVPVHWSSCSIDQLNIAFSRGMNYCLRNKPAKLFDSPQCGNGFVEPGEQCDCGLPNYCENTCCDPYTCMLHSNASCATGECCDLSTCRPKQAGTACRINENECDLPEYCTGESEYCPMDVFKRDTEECDAGQAFCFQGQCRSHSNQCRILWGSTGENSKYCYINNTQGNKFGNCGYNRIKKTFLACETEDVACGMLQCRHLSASIEFGEALPEFYSNFLVRDGQNLEKSVPCSSALLDFGLQSADPGLTPNGAKCGDNKMCVNQKCRKVGELRAKGVGKACPEQCNGNGVCNSRGNCHCDIGYSGTTCLAPGPGGSVDSGPATNPNIYGAILRWMSIFFGVVCFMTMFYLLWTYCHRTKALTINKN